MLITDKQLRLVMPHASPLRISTHIGPLNAAMEEFEISTADRIRMFVAQIAHESGELRYFEELADGSAYDNRADLGNTKPEAIAVAAAHGTTPGRFWKGHGPIQVTGFDNHCAAGKALDLDLKNNPALAANVEAGFRVSAWFWFEHKLNEIADAGDFLGVSKVINLGNRNSPHTPNHYAERVAYFTLAQKAIP